jgi:hypothetical protein
MNKRSGGCLNVLLQRLLVCFLLLTAVHSFGKRPLTFYKDIQPLIYKNCVSCHRTGQCAPFPLVTYNDVLKHASMIKAVTTTGYMPPWKADTSYRNFVDQRILTKDEINAITSWVENGAPAGDKSDALSFSVINNRSNLGTPDLVLTAPEKFTVPGTGEDTVEYFVMHYTLPSDTNVLAFEFVPGNPKAVHHSNTWVFPEESEYERFYRPIEPPVIPSPIVFENIPTQFDLFMDALFVRNAPPKEAGFEYPDFFPKVSPLYYDGWVPGTSARTWPDGFGFKLPGKGVVIMQIHYGPTPVELVDQSSVNIFFTDKNIERMIESFNIGTGGGIAEPEPALILPPDSVKYFEITAVVNKDQSYIALNPHMHYLGKEMKAYAVTPANDTIQLVWIKNWDFRWQEFYKPTSLVKIPHGSLLKVCATFDNTSDNPFNKFDPPRTIKGGSNSTEEMMSLIIMSVEYREGDEHIILNSDLATFNTETPKKTAH